MYNKLNWVNDQSPALNATNLNRMDQGIYDIHDIVYNAGFKHNNLFKEENILASFDNGTFSTNIANGKFENIYPGQYFTKSVTIDGTAYNVKFVVADIDTFFGGYNSYAVVNTHHVAVIAIGLPNARMNATNTTEGGYFGSEMYTTLQTYLAAISTALGENSIGDTHIVGHQKRYSTAINPTGYNRFGTNNGCANNWEWKENQYISLLTESQVYGHPVWSSSGYDTGEAHRQLSIFKAQNYNKVFGNRWVWLRDVVNSSYFANAANYGNAASNNASNVGSVVPLLLLK